MIPLLYQLKSVVKFKCPIKSGTPEKHLFEICKTFVHGLGYVSLIALKVIPFPGLLDVYCFSLAVEIGSIFSIS